MPTYEYECNDCGHRFEKHRAVADRLNVVCESCSKKRVSIVIGSSVGVISYGSEFCRELGVEITGPRQRKEVLKAKGLIDIGDTKPSDLPRQETEFEKEIRKPELERKVHQAYQMFESTRGDGVDANKKMQVIASD